MERRLSAVPRPVMAILALALAAHLIVTDSSRAQRAGLENLPPAPNVLYLRASSFGDPIPVAKLMMLYVQAFDLQAANPIPFREMDYDNLITWLRVILLLDPTGQYPLFTASRIYAIVPDQVRSRKMLDFIYTEFFKDPNRRWPWLADAAVIAKHQLNDLPLAQRYAAAVQEKTTSQDIPLWAKQMNAFILEDMNELEQARIMIGGYIASGQIKEPGELRLLEQRLREIEAKAGKKASRH
jgi:hypothetical protein